MHKFDVGEHIVFTVGNPLRNVRIHSFEWRIHKLNVGEYTVFTMGNPLRNMSILSFWGGEYTSGMLENTQFVL